MRKTIGLFLNVLACICCLSLAANAATYHVGSGEPGSYATLRELIVNGSPPLTNGDVVILHADDASLLGQAINLTDLDVFASDGPVSITQAPGAKPAQGGIFKFSNTAAALTLRGVTLHDASAVAGSSGSGHGGAIYINNSLNMSGAANVSFINNSALGTNSTATGQGGAVYVYDSLDLSGARNLKFLNNAARGGAHTTGAAGNSGLGGALYAFNTLDMRNADTVTFANNTAQAPTWGGSGFTSGGGQGGAVYASKIDFTGANAITFSGNQALGTDSGAGPAASSGQGGAIYVGTLGMTMDGARNFLFTGNTASGIQGTNAGFSGLGGALFIVGPSDISGAAFIGNKAATANTGDLTSGLGGAVYVSAPSLTLNAAPGRDIVFSGNTHNPGNSGETPNSIYFGNIGNLYPAATTAFTVDAAAGSEVRMLDPIASTPDGFGPGNLTLAVTKTGPGDWVLAGRNTMDSATEWSVGEGALYLEIVDTPTRIELNHDATATFAVNGGAAVLVAPTVAPHVIHAREITFAAGSGAGIWHGGAFSYFELPNQARTPLLTLEAETSLVNDSAIINPDGAFTSGMYDYTYGLYWRKNGLTHDLMGWIKEKEYNPEVGGSSATTAPSAIVAQGAMSRMLGERMYWNFDCFNECPDTIYSASTPEGEENPCDKSFKVWGTPSYTYTSSSTRSKYSIRTPGFGVGVDKCFDKKFFLGMGLYAFWPEYRSRHADIDATDLNIALYGGALLPGEVELGLMAAYGHTRYDQERSVRGHSYDVDYSSDSWRLGVNLGRRFQLADSWILRPFASYEYVRLAVDGYKEKAEPYALKVRSHDENMHFLRAGTDVTWLINEAAHIRGQVYYLGLLGDTRPEADATFVTDADRHAYTSYGDRLDRNMLGLGLDGVLRVSKDFELALRYSFETGKDTYSHYGGVYFTLNF